MILLPYPWHQLLPGGRSILVGFVTLSIARATIQSMVLRTALLLLPRRNRVLSIYFQDALLLGRKNTMHGDESGVI